MPLKDTILKMKTLLSEIVKDIEKSEGGNKAASQRVRIGTIKLAKIAKVYRQESLATEKKEKPMKKKPISIKPKSRVKAKTSVRSSPDEKNPKLLAMPAQIKKATAKIPSKRF